MIVDLDQILEEKTEVRLLSRTFSLLPIKLKTLMSLTVEMQTLSSAMGKGDVVSQYFAVFSQVLEGMTIEDVGNMSTDQIRALYVIILEKITGKKLTSESEVEKKK